MKNNKLIKIGKASSLVLLALLLFYVVIPLPQPVFDVPYATTLKAKDGILLSAAIADDQQWRFPVSDSIPKKLEIAFLLFEDEYFHYHLGVNPVSIVRAVRQNISAGKTVSGGSTITMQTVRMTLGNQPRTYIQKLLEIVIAIKLEMQYSKSSILKLYADHAPYGGNVVGVSAASYRFFGRPPHQLSWAEAATLAVLPNSPSSIFPGKNQQAFLNKRDRLLQKIHDSGVVDEDELFLAKQEPLPKRIKAIPNQAYHLLYTAMADGHKGTDIASTLEAQLQAAASELVNEHSKALSFNQIQNAAAVILDIKSGNTLAYVGNSKSTGTHGQHVDVITARRSPGSLLKPFLYAAALDESLISPKELLPDIPVFYKGFAPKNFDKEYRGAVPADDALISSLNVPFVHLLIKYGYEKFHQKLLQMGFAAFDKPASHYGLSIILGGAETTLWELTSVYASMARAYQNYDHRPINQGYAAADYHSNYYLQQVTSTETPALAEDGYMRVPSIHFALEAMQKLSRPEEESGWQQFQSSRQIAWKTGTSYGFRDGWAIGFNDEHLVGVWVGNADGEGRPGLTGVSAAAPLLFKLFDLIEGNAVVHEPFGISKEVCAKSGMLASKHCLETNLVALPDYLLYTKNCSYHQLIHLNKEGASQVNSTCYNVTDMVQQSWFVLPPVQAWYYRKFHSSFKKLPPFEGSCVQSNGGVQLDLIYPGQFTKVKIPLDQSGTKGQSIFEAAHQDPSASVYWHLDEEYLGQTQRTHQMGIQADIGLHTITLIDEFGNELSQSFEVIE